MRKGNQPSAVPFAQEDSSTQRSVVDGLADLGINELDRGANEGTRCVVLAAITAGVTLVLDLHFVDIAELVLIVLRAKAELVDLVNDVSKVVDTGDAVTNLIEDLADLILDGVRALGPGFEPTKVRK